MGLTSSKDTGVGCGMNRMETQESRVREIPAIQSLENQSLGVTKQSLFAM